MPGTEKVVTLEPGKTLGRYGEIGPNSDFVTQPGANADALSLPPTTSSNVYQEYIVVKPIPQTTQSTVAPWGGSAGGGVQYKLPKPIQWYIDNGYLTKKQECEK